MVRATYYASRVPDIPELYLPTFPGEMERLQKFWLAGACKKNDNEGESSMPLGILNFTSAFILLAGGMLLGGLLLLLEHTYFKFFRSKLRKWDKCGCCGLVSLVRPYTNLPAQNSAQAILLNGMVLIAEHGEVVNIWAVSERSHRASEALSMQEPNLRDADLETESWVGSGIA